MFQPIILGIHVIFVRGVYGLALEKCLVEKNRANLGQWNPNGNALFSCLTLDEPLRKVPHSYGCLPKGRSQRSELPPRKKNSHSRTKRCILLVSNSTVKHKEFNHHNQTKRLVIAGPLSSVGQSTTLLRKESTKHTPR